jgi:hypothetical protein
LRAAELRENVEEKIMALNGLAVAQSRVDLLQQYETLSKAASLVESSMRDGRTNHLVFKHIFYRFGLVCSAIIQTGHYTLYAASKQTGLNFAQERWHSKPSEAGGKKDQVVQAVCLQTEPSSLARNPTCVSTMKSKCLKLSTRSSGP